MLQESKEIWTDEVSILRPVTADELLSQALGAIWHTKMLHILPDRLPPMGAEELDEMYSNLANEIFQHLSGEATTRKWGAHPREVWIDVKSKSAAAGKDHARALHTDEAGIQDGADIVLMYCVAAASSGGGNNFISTDHVWQRLLAKDAALAERLLSCPIPYRVDGTIQRQPALRHQAGRTFINFNSKLVCRGLDASTDATVNAFTEFLERDLNERELFDVTLPTGGAMLWWDELFLHGRRPVQSGAEKRAYRKVGIAIRPSPTRISRRSRRSQRTSSAKESSASSNDGPADFCDKRLLYAIHDQISSRKQTGIPFVIGMSGINASGKSTFSRNLAKAAEALGWCRRATVLSIDDFHWPKRRRYSDDFAGRAFLTGYFDRKRLIDRVLRPLKQNCSLHTEFTILDERRDEYISVRHLAVEHDDLLIVEGVFLFQDDMVPYFDLTLLLDVPLHIAMSRIVGRRAEVEWFGSLLAKFFERYLLAHMRYANMSSRASKAMITIDFSDAKNPVLASAPSMEWPVLGNMRELKLGT